MMSSIFMALKGFLFCGALLFGIFPSGVSLHFAQAQTPATLFFIPSTVQLAQNQTVWVTIMVNTGGQKANALAASFSYPQDKIQVLEVSTAGSETLTTIVAPSEYGGGKVKVGGGSADGFSGVKKVAQVRLQAKVSLGSAALTFLDDSAVLLEANSSNVFNVASSPAGTINFTQAPPPAPTPTPTPVPAPVPTPGPEPSLLRISDIRAEKLSEESVQISWKTNQATKASLRYGPSSREYPFSFLSGIFETEHSFMLSGIQFSEDYSLEIIGIDERGNQIKAENLNLGDLLGEEEIPAPQPVNGAEDGGFEIRSPMVLIFIGLPLFVFLVVAVLIFLRRRSNP